MDTVDHLPCTDRPVILGVRRTPFFSAVEAEHNVVFGLVAGVDHCLRHGQHQTDGTVVILEAPEMHIVVPAH